MKYALNVSIDNAYFAYLPVPVPLSARVVASVNVYVVEYVAVESTTSTTPATKPSTTVTSTTYRPIATTSGYTSTASIRSTLTLTGRCRSRDNRRSYQNGEEWTDDHFIARCYTDANGNWHVKVIACLIPNHNIRVLINQSVIFASHRWECSGRNDDYDATVQLIQV